MRIVHLTDPHLTTLSGVRWHQLRGKRWSGYLSWRQRRRYLHRSDMLERLLTAVQAEQADLIALTGDLVHIGLATEIAQAAQWLRRLGSPERVLLVPGNHDLYAADSWTAVKAQWGAYLHFDGSADPSSPYPAYPLYWRFPGISVIAVCSSLPTPLFMATGQVGEAQGERLSALLAEARSRRDYTVVLIHHPPLPGQTHWRKALTDAGPLSARLRDGGADLVLHGHLHKNEQRIAPPLHVFGTASASSVAARELASYRVFDIAPGAAGAVVTMRLMQAEHAEHGGFGQVEQLSCCGQQHLSCCGQQHLSCCGQQHPAA